MFERAASGAWLRAPLTMLLALGMMLGLPFSTTALAQEAEYDRFSMEVVGDGPDVILIPGLSMPRESWDGTVEALSGSYRLHLLQVRGFGEPAGVNAEGSPVLEPLVEELAAYIEEEGLEDPAIVGHSMGGLVALMLGSTHPEVPGRLVIVDALPWVGVLYGGPIATVGMMQPQITAMRDALLAAAENPISEEAVAAETRGIRSEEGRRLVADWMRQADLRVTAHAFYDDIMADLRTGITAITAPLTVMVPWTEDLPGEEATLALYRNQYLEAPQARIVGIANSSHFIMLDQPETFHAALEAALEE